MPGQPELGRYSDSRIIVREWPIPCHNRDQSRL
jgi:hypothetical protein